MGPLRILTASLIVSALMGCGGAGDAFPVEDVVDAGRSDSELGAVDAGPDAKASPGSGDDAGRSGDPDAGSSSDPDSGAMQPGEDAAPGRPIKCVTQNGPYTCDSGVTIEYVHDNGTETVPLCGGSGATCPLYGTCVVNYDTSFPIPGTCQ